ncbi:hypothetical protein [Spongiactinospora sp. TRM90649]|uniref:hypothetical protein n=1 Tax=Spongiactinospora sp. TRM90649 TaxID=3031114 RepID=UPI0023F79B52|nr:hypothetical protein [Spongiactinospora sp. TRM90649]MDF5759016.1 hypothetical protein [Spongiactinospora sp. TRM90649]
MIGVDLLGKSLTQVRATFYEFQGTTEKQEGLVELTFTDGTCRRFEVGADGESLRGRAGPWVDPFTAPLSEENEHYVRQHGKYTAFDLADEPGYRQIIGRRVSEVRPIFDEESGKQIGVVANFDGICLCIEVAADELYVSFEKEGTR